MLCLEISLKKCVENELIMVACDCC